MMDLIEGYRSDFLPREKVSGRKGKEDGFPLSRTLKRQRKKFLLGTDPEKHDYMPPRTSVPPQRGMTKEVFGCPWFRVHEEGWNGLSDSDRQPFYRIESSDGVLVLAMTRNEEIILVRQF